ncbi:MAG: arginine--tRNA ligase [Fidelibacterota bacterium]
MIIPQLKTALTEALQTLDLQAGEIQLSPPKNPQFGDLSSNLALVLAHRTNRNPMELAGEIKNRIKLNLAYVAEISITAPGFINFRFTPDYYYEVLDKILLNPEFGRGTSGNSKTANVEFVSANPTGPLTVGHGRQAVLGDTVASILEWHNYDVTREYYYNDAGRQMRLLAKSVEARYFQILDQKTEFPEDGYQGKYIREIARKIKNLHGTNLKPGNSLFLETAEKNIFNKITTSLKRLGISHDIFSNEKTFYDSGATQQTIEDLKAKGLVYEADGASWFKTTALGMAQDRVLIKGSGEPTYRLPDITYHRNKLERGYDLIVDIFGADHLDAYPDVLAALKVLGYNIGNIRVLIHQFVTLIRKGEKVKMSTRKGTFVTLEELVKEVGRDVVRYFFIMRGMNSHLNFDLDLASDQSEKNPVYYLQYAHARICNIIKRAKSTPWYSDDNFNSALLKHSAELELLKKLELFPMIMEQVLDSLEPQIIANYLQETATRFHKFYSECRVISDDEDLSRARLALVKATRIILANGLKVLGIQAPERM